MNRRDFISAASVAAASTTMPTMTVAQSNRGITNDPSQAGAKLRAVCNIQAVAVVQER